MDPKPRVALVVNPGAGGGLDAEALAARVAAVADVTRFDVGEGRDPEACARDAVRADVDLVLAVGGDGTVSGVAAALRGTGVPLGIVPAGTANSIALGLGIPTGEAALALLDDGEIRTLDTARANGRNMILHASVGLIAETIADTARADKRRWGPLAYVATGFGKVARGEPFSAAVEVWEGRATTTVRCRATNLTIANLAPPRTVVAQGPSVIAPDDGRLDLTIVSASGFLRACAAGWHLLRTAWRGEPATRDDVGYVSSWRFRVVTDPPQRVLVDGEDVGETPLEVECVPASLRVLVPRAPAGEAVRARDASRAPERKLLGLPGLVVARRPRSA